MRDRFLAVVDRVPGLAWMVGIPSLVVIVPLLFTVVIHAKSTPKISAGMYERTLVAPSGRVMLWKSPQYFDGNHTMTVSIKSADGTPMVREPGAWCVQAWHAKNIRVIVSACAFDGEAIKVSVNASAKTPTPFKVVYGQ